ncbi:MAG: phosphatase PAP2 family protein [Actinobacteria bacterium]|nr:phosphatase PAP2 family protein [Actinomycetota bacterium]
MSRKWVIRSLVAAAVVLFFVFRDQLPEFNLEEVIEDLSEGLGSWTYLLVGVLAFLETGAFVGLIAPGEFTVLLGGAVAGQGYISLPLILAITWLSAFLGDTVSFTLGSRLGRGFLVKHGSRFRITEERLAQVEAYFARHGGKTIVIGRFIGLVRAVAPFIAGTSKMGYRAFCPYSVIGTGLWAATFIMIGYFASQSLDTVAEIVSRGLIWFGVLVGCVVGVIAAVHYLRDPDNRRRLAAEIERRPLLRPALAFARRLRPEVKFLWQRLTPGDLGLEFTTLMAVLLVGLFVLIAYWSIVSMNPGPTPGDTTAYDLSEGLASGWLEDLAKEITALGSLWVVAPVALAAGAFLAWRRSWIEFGVLAVGIVATVFFVHEIQDWVDRPRPPGGVTDARGSSFPSAHAAYATIYTWLATTVALRIEPWLVRRSLLIGAGVALTVVIGLTCVYLRVYWLSDVTAGWALGFSAFAAAAAVALVIGHFSDNSGSDDRAAASRSRSAAGAGD